MDNIRSGVIGRQLINAVNKPVISVPDTPHAESFWPTWIADPTSIAFFHAIDFWFGAIGFAITIATFWLGWKKLVKVEEAANRAKTAVEEMKLRVSRYDATVDASEALYSYKEITRHLDPVDWRSIVRGMSSVRRCAIRMDKPLESIDQITARELRRAVKRLDKHISAIEEAMVSPLSFPEDNAIRSSIRAGEEALEKAKRVIEESIS